MKYQDLSTTSASTFKRLVGVSRDTFSKMVKEAIDLQPLSNHKVKGNIRGPKPKLRMEDKVLMLLMYYREYRTFLHIATTFGISEAQCWRIITSLEKLLIKSQLFHIKGKKRLLSEDTFQIILIDVAESPIERPKKKQRKYYSGKKKRHTIKTQVVVNKETKEIISVIQSPGKKHDFRLFKESKTYVKSRTKIQVDTGYLGIAKKHSNVDIPKKKTKKIPLTKGDKKRNREISSSRVLVENVIRCLKIFRILAEKYRNRRKRFGLRLNLIAGLYNFQL